MSWIYKRAIYFLLGKKLRFEDKKPRIMLIKASDHINDKYYESDCSHSSIHQDGFERRELGAIIENASFGATMPEFDFDSWILKTLCLLCSTSIKDYVVGIIELLNLSLKGSYKHIG